MATTYKYYKAGGNFYGVCRAKTKAVSFIIKHLSQDYHATWVYILVTQDTPGCVYNFRPRKRREIYIWQHKKRKCSNKRKKIRIRLKAYDHVILEQSAERIVDTAKKNRSKSIRSYSITNTKGDYNNLTFSTQTQRL